MNDWHNFFNHVDDNLATSTYRIFEEQSKAEILDWCSREDVAKEQKEDFIQALIDFEDDCGDFYKYRAYFLAAEAINYFKDCSLGDAIALQILQWSYAYFRQDKQYWQIVPQPLVEAARLILEVTERQRVIAAFVHLVHTTQSQKILHLAAEKLGKLDPGNKSAIAALVLLLEVTQDESTIWNITNSLMQIDPDNPVVIPSLVKLISVNTTDEWLTTDCRRYIIRYAVEALGKVSLGNEIAIDALVWATQTITDPNDIICAVDNLGAIARGNETAINALIKLIQTTENKNICLYSIISLGEIALGNQNAIAALTEFLQINQGDRICLKASIALWKIDEGNFNAIATLVQIIVNTADKFYLSRAADYLLEIDPTNRDAIAALIERINTADEYVFCQAAASLLKFEPESELALSILLNRLQNETNLSFRWQIAERLLRVNPNNQIAIDALFAIVQYLGQSSSNIEDVSFIAWDTILSLQKIDPSNQLVVSALVNLLSTAQKDSYFYIAVGCLGSFAKGNKNASAALTKFIDSIDDIHFLCHTAYNLGRIAPGNQKALSILIEFIQTFDEWNNIESFSHAESRRSHSDSPLPKAADKLQQILPINQMPQVVVALKDYLSKSKQDSSYRYEACYSLIWHCAQNMSYPDFYATWYKS